MQQEMMQETVSATEEITAGDFETLFGDTPLTITDSEVKN